MTARAGARSAVTCAACREIAERSGLYERWLFAENHADTSTLEAVAAARGFCSQHARALLDRDPGIAEPIASFVLRTCSAHTSAQRRSRSGYRDALDAASRCPWCLSEREALKYALSGRRQRDSLCAPHRRVCEIAKRNEADPYEPPLCVTTPLEPSLRPVRQDDASWWSPSVERLAAMLRTSCAACDAGCEASRRREAFLRGGPRPGEHWEAPTLCVAHHVALGSPEGSEYLRAPDGVYRVCDCCVAIRRATSGTISLFSVAYRDAAFRLFYARVPGLCLPHAAAALHHTSTFRDELLTATLLRIDTMVWELDERSQRRSWGLRDQGEPPDAGDLAQRAWWLIAGGTFRYEQEAP